MLLQNIICASRQLIVSSAACLYFLRPRTQLVQSIGAHWSIQLLVEAKHFDFATWWLVVQWCTCHFSGELFTNSKHAKWEFEERSCIMQPRTSYRFGQDKDITTYQMSWGVLFWRAAVSNDGCHHLHGSPPHLVSADNQKRAVGALKLCIKKTRWTEMNVDCRYHYLTSHRDCLTISSKICLGIIRENMIVLFVLDLRMQNAKEVQIQ